MKNQKNDRRSQRTRSLIDRAFVELLVEKTYDTITVQDIIDRANVGRSTFYAHYLDKEDVLTSQFQWLIENLHQAPLTDMAQGTLASLEIFRHTQAHHHLYKALMWGQGGEMIFKIWYGLINHQIEQVLIQYLNGRPSTVPPLVLATFISGAFLALLRWWLDNNMPYPPEEINRMFEQMVMPSIKAVLELET